MDGSITVESQGPDETKSRLDALEKRVADLEALHVKRKPIPPPTSWDVPEQLQNFSLYRQDYKLCQGWAEAYAGWKLAYPKMNIFLEIAKAHAWEIANPLRRKKHHIKFLAYWLRRAQEWDVKVGVLKEPPVVKDLQ